jgi:hypothetical protein
MSYELIQVVNMTYQFGNPREWLLETSPTLQAQSWRQSLIYATPASRWCAYINQICLDTFLNWTKTEYFPEATVWPNAHTMTTFWEFVNGTAILLRNQRVVLIPSEAIDDSELEIPQEWVDIPNWAADYYLAVQVKPDGESVRIWGYITHKQLKSVASYDPLDRTYCIDAHDLTKDLNAFCLSVQFCTEEETQATITPLPELSTTVAENLISRLSNSTVTFPRLAIPFTTWASLLAHEHWRQRLYEQRQQSRSVKEQEPVNLSRWLKGIYETPWQPIETILGSNSKSLAFNFRSVAGLRSASIRRAKLIDLGMQIKSQKVVLLIALIPENDRQVSVRVQLHPPLGEIYLPANIKLALLLESGETIQEVQAREQDNYVQLKRFDVEVGEYFNIQIALDGYQIAESFVV